MEKISEAVVSKVSLDAQAMIKEAEEKAREEIERATKQRGLKLDQERARILAEAEQEAARILAQASIKARQLISGAKAEAIAKITEGARNELSGASTNQSNLLSLIREAAGELGTDKTRIYVSTKDVGAAKESLQADKELSAKILEVREVDCLGGVIAEDAEGKLRIDNTYETRLEMALPKLLPKISEELFKAP
jgi:V/A-type H+-transporting ATPase subunit E